ncbi:lytic transglycosylase domain-containing protein [Siccirubricoccus phaeus]|uniref:lytic transglycosylase domain-containing protein n=1 Tax=Siccirubricoccus phaeus TaxID=2595053 RepID=UPI0011F366BA|nr:lytic transglycosylase domain-containing protein [Siccirubricoccus phaeus]
MALLAACGQQAAQQRGPATHVAATYGSYNRPASYDPPGPASDPWGPWIREAARRFDVPERWIREVMRQESGGRVSATSPVGAMGLMQVMPGTYRELQARYGLGDDPYHPYDSIMAGAAYIREMYDLYGSPAFLAAYNAGPRRLEDYLWSSRGLPTETRNYVARIGPRIVDAHPRRRVAPEIYAAAEIPLNIPPGPRRMDSATMLALREQRQALDPGVQLAQLPPGPVVRMDPIPDGSTATASLSPPVQVASLGAVPLPGGVVRMDPIPDGSTPQGAARMAEMEAESARGTPAPVPRSAEPPIAPPARAAAPAQRGTLLASAALPPPVPRGAQRHAAPPAPSRQAVALAAPPSPARSRGLGLVGSANAAPAPLRAALSRPEPSGGGQWAVQVGAFASQAQARSAAASAAGTAGGRVQVLPVAQGRSTLYRARVIGLSPAGAQNACNRLRRGSACMVLSPDAQG